MKKTILVVFLFTLVGSGVFGGFQKGQKWAWWCCLIAGLIVWGYRVYIQAGEGDMLNMILHLVGIVLLFIGLLLPIRSFFGKKA